MRTEGSMALKMIILEDEAGLRDGLKDFSSHKATLSLLLIAGMRP